jgi:hypothetical protein
MKITRRTLAEMIEQEVRAHLQEKDDGKKGSKKSKKPTTAAADQEPTEPNAPADGGGVEPISSAPPIDGGMNDQEADDEPQDNDGDGVPDPETEDPTDGVGQDDAEAIDADGEGGEEPSGAVNQELAGKTVQAISIEPESMNLPGAKEVVISFNETQDTLKIIITATGEVKFGWPCDSTGKAKQVHDIP